MTATATPTATATGIVTCDIVVNLCTATPTATPTNTPTPTPTPMPFEGKVTGGGWIPVSGGNGKANFGFEVQAEEDENSQNIDIDGELQYDNHGTDPDLHSTSITSLTVVGNTATFTGTCTLHGNTPCTFKVVVQDNDPHGQDTFSITYTGGSASGTVHGHIEIHRDSDQDGNKDDDD